MKATAPTGINKEHIPTVHPEGLYTPFLLELFDIWKQSIWNHKCNSVKFRNYPPESLMLVESLIFVV